MKPTDPFPLEGVPARVRRVLAAELNRLQPTYAEVATLSPGRLLRYRYVGLVSVRQVARMLRRAGLKMEED